LPYSNGADRPLVLSVDNPYNPFGSRFYSATGAANADGTARVTGTPQTVTIMSKRIMDMGQERTEIDTDIVRVLAGARGKVLNTWTWEAAAYYTRARTVDEVQNALRESALLAAALRTDASAFNPFGYTFRVANGAVIADAAYTNPASVMNPIYDKLPNIGRTSIASGDLRASGEIFRLWSGPVSLAVGGEFREEKLSHTRPPFAGLNPPGSGLDLSNNDFVQASATANIVGKRTVASAYAETVIPLASPENRWPLLHSLELSASARFESYDDFGETTKPKFGANWKPFSWAMVRGSYNQGFRAPNLALLNQRERTFVQTYADTYRLLITGNVGDNNANRTYTTAGNAALQPEFSKGKSVGLVIEVPRVKGLSFSVDYWQIDQRAIIDADTTTQVITNDYQLLVAYTQQQLTAGTPLGSIDVGSGTANYRGDPRVTRAAMSPADVAAFAAFNAARPTSERVANFGPITSLRTAFSNRSAGFVSGTDLGLNYQLPENALGRFTFGSEWTYFEKGYTTTPGTNVRDKTVNQNGNTSLTWRKGPWTTVVSGYYIGPFVDTGATTSASLYESLGRPSYISVVNDLGTLNYYYRVASSLSFNAFASYRFDRGAGRWLRNSSLRIGVTNFTDEAPPLTADPPGYQASVYNYLALGRTWTFEFTRRF
jgi:outer membrane receptor protein involved in Fe transport